MMSKYNLETQFSEKKNAESTNHYNTFDSGSRQIKNIARVFSMFKTFSQNSPGCYMCLLNPSESFLV